MGAEGPGRSSVAARRLSGLRWGMPRRDVVLAALRALSAAYADDPLAPELLRALDALHALLDAM